MNSEPAWIEDEQAVVELAALLCSRLCHDLVSPIGAISTGMEILSDEKDEDMRQQVLNMVASSVQQASSRLQFARMAFGAGTGVAGTVDLAEVQRLTAGLAGGGKVRIEWLSGVSQTPKAEAKLLMNLIMIGMEALPRGGDITVRYERHDERPELELVCEGVGAVVRPEYLSALKGEMAFTSMEPREAQACYTRLLARLSKMDVSVENQEDRVVLRAT